MFFVPQRYSLVSKQSITKTDNEINKLKTKVDSLEHQIIMLQDTERQGNKRKRMPPSVDASPSVEDPNSPPQRRRIGGRNRITPTNNAARVARDNAESTSIAQNICEGIKTILKDTLRGDQGPRRVGTRPLAQQRFLDTILAVVAHGLKTVGSTHNQTKIFTFLGVNKKTYAKATKIVKALSTSNKNIYELEPLLQRKTRQDAMRPKSLSFVKDYSHNDDNSQRSDSNNSKAKTIDGTEHRPRIWENVLKSKRKTC